MAGTLPRQAAVMCVLLCMAPLCIAQQCGIHSDQEGPLYFSGAPFREGGVVCAPGPSSDVVITISGTVRTEDCADVVPFAVLDLWQASSEADGTFYYGCGSCTGDNSKWADGPYYCRSKVTADKDGAFVFKTVMPGRYSSRPVVHIHAKVFLAGETGSAHTTQLYFTDDAASDSIPDKARMTVAADNTATIDIATPFAASDAAAAAASATPAATSAPGTNSGGESVVSGARAGAPSLLVVTTALALLVVALARSEGALGIL
mmetsp:Transcript_24882/g.57688  ORF Transcript_24882/g.57688 Transcript_24882/m.57688 type:complete len:261 (-) Transcript_24882:431-1213(-)